MFWKKGKPRNLKEELQHTLAARAKIRDMAAGIAAGRPGPVFGGKELLERLREQTAYREQVALKTRIAQIEAEIEAETHRLEEETERAEQKLGEPLSLTILALIFGPVIGGLPIKVARGAKLEIQWTSTGPTGDKIRIGLLRGGRYLKTISSSVPISAETYSWLVPSNPNHSPAGDYQISLQDPDTGLFEISDSFQIA